MRKNKYSFSRIVFCQEAIIDQQTSKLLQQGIPMPISQLVLERFFACTIRSWHYLCKVLAGWLIGKGGRTIREMQENSGAFLHVIREDFGTLWSQWTSMNFLHYVSLFCSQGWTNSVVETRRTTYWDMWWGTQRYLGVFISVFILSQHLRIDIRASTGR